ncbi:sensor histidine kinase [Endozoicomonas sp. SM1973]|uniref:histidine kinase n=1 Tax=Spartinivicinus marinus TaxID=2994442 RepID=A0A853I0T0_9GAMM|nr:HAMP domain-containing sensor histidine kinase [Spartinivicinus marinus]MCX4027027.1 HAMP domain-containing sensor histidine kinase [Spartinivicinus marinus]NYZ67023.1 sensor histidine kinase [Spartinivicinus marinus]
MKKLSVQQKIKFVLVLLIFLPICILAWLSFQLQKNERVVQAHQIQNLIDSKLKAVERELTAYFEQLEIQLRSDYQTLTNIQQPKLTHQVRNYLYDSPLVQNIFILVDSDNITFPPDSLASRKEQSFINQTKPIWSNPELFQNLVSQDEMKKIQAASESDAKLEAFVSPASQKKAVASFAPDVVSSGWVSWYSGSHSRLLYWVKDSTSRVIGFDLNRMRMLSDLINRLPDATYEDNGLHESAIRLLNDKSNTLYQWGNYSIEEGEQALRTRYLSPPLANWKIAYFTDKSTIAKLSWVGNLAGLLAFTIALIGLGTYFYREQQREMVQAQQRVSFVNQVSHELKTPLTNIRMYAELLTDQLFDEDQQHNKYLKVITGESLRLSRLIENVLNFSRAQRNAIKINKAPGIIDECVKNTIVAFEASLHNKGMLFEVKYGADQTVYFDKGIVEQILNNLFSNAEKYAHDGKIITVITHLENNQCKITVQDYGTGIPASARNKIFEPFYRVSSKLTDGISGTGIGLSIAKQLAKLHGGELTLVTSEVGACFVLNIDISPA